MNYMNGGNQLKYKKIVSAGCSFIHGSELGDEVPFSNQTYPALLAKHYDLDYDCIAYPSASNQGIAKKIFDYKDSKDCLFVVQWTFPSRLGVHLSYKYFDKNKNQTDWFDLAPNNWDLIGHFYEYREHTEQLKNLQIDKLSNTVYKHIGNDNNFLFQTKISIDAVKLHLVELGAEFLFIAGCNSILNYPGIISFENKGFVEWCADKNFKIGTHKHPLHDAHRSAFEYIIQNVNILND